MGNGAFGAWAASNIVFKAVRVTKNHCEGVDGRGKPSSNSLVFAGGSEGGVASTGLTIAAGLYSQLCNNNLLWPSAAFAAVQLTEQEFSPREPLQLSFCWEAMSVHANEEKKRIQRVVIVFNGRSLLHQSGILR